MDQSLLLKIRRNHRLLLAVLLLAVLVLPLSSSEAQGDSFWITIQNAGLGYRFRAPRGAAIRLYRPAGVLHLEIPSTHQVMSVQVFENPQQLSAQKWADANLFNPAGKGVNPQVTTLPVTGRAQVQIGRQTAETFVVIGPVLESRSTIFSSGGRIYQVDLAPGEGGQPGILLQILDSFEFDEGDGSFSGGDSGFEVISSTQGQDIPSLPVLPYMQSDRLWGCDQLGSCGCWWGACAYYTGIADAGCYITSEAMVFDYYTGHYKDPGELNECLTENNGYGLWEGCGWGVCAATYDPIAACKPKQVSYLGMNGDLSVLDEDLRNGFPVIAWIDGGRHYVVIKGKKAGLYQINDPLFPRTEIYDWQIVYFIRLHGPKPSAATPTPAPTRVAAPHEFFLPHLMGK